MSKYFLALFHALEDLNITETRTHHSQLTIFECLISTTINKLSVILSMMHPPCVLLESFVGIQWYVKNIHMAVWTYSSCYKDG